MSNHLRIRDPGGGRILDRTPAAPENLVSIRGLGGRRILLRREAAQAYENLLTAAQREAGIGGNLLRLVSGYRDPTVQQRLWQQALQRYGTPQLARRWVAPPGRSAHQTGRALDLHLGVPIGSRYVNQQRQTQAYRWLQNNANRFGFYPYEREPWHWEFNPPRRGLHEEIQRREHEEAQARLTRQQQQFTTRIGTGYRPTIRSEFREKPMEIPLPGGRPRYYYEAGNYFPLHYEYGTNKYYLDLNYTKNPKRPFVLVQDYWKR